MIESATANARVRRRMPNAHPSDIELQGEFDPRLVDVWVSVFEHWPADELPRELGWFLRMAYLQGYADALSERERGALFRRFGMEPPLPGPRREIRSGKGAGS